MIRGCFRSVLWISLFFLFVGSSAALAVQDGFRLSKQIKSRYFTIYMREGVDAERLAMKVSVPAAIQAIVRSPTAGFQPDRLEDQLDLDRKSTRLNSSHNVPSRMPSSA